MSLPPAVRRADVAATARMAAAAGLVEAFGHVSARTSSGFLITSTRPMHGAVAEDVITVESGTPVAGPVGELPLETPMHAAIYRARPDVAAICRGHPPHAVVWGVATAPLPLLHGLGGIAGAVVRVHPEIELVKSAGSGAEAATTLGDCSSVLLQGNGALSVGSDLLEAATRLWFLEERARVAVEARRAGVGPVDERRRTWERRLDDSDAELRRAKRWMLSAFGQPASPEGPGDPP